MREELWNSEIVYSRSFKLALIVSRLINTNELSFVFPSLYLSFSRAIRRIKCTLFEFPVEYISESSQSKVYLSLGDLRVRVRLGMTLAEVVELLASSVTRILNMSWTGDFSQPYYWMTSENKLHLPRSRLSNGSFSKSAVNSTHVYI